MISWQGSGCELFDTATVQELIKQIENIEANDFATFFKLAPPVAQLIQAIPHSLPVLDCIYTKCVQMKGEGKFPVTALMCDELFSQLLWWIAHAEEHKARVSGTALNFALMRTTVGEPQRSKLTITDWEVPMRSLLSVMHSECASVLDTAQQERAQLADCLEALGCHGLVNCSTGLIRLFDAIRLETNRHYEKIKLISIRLKDMHRLKQSVDAIPSGASHQRQMNLHLSEVFERLKQNESMENILDEILSNHHLSSLLRIVRKRVHSDKMLISLFNLFNKAAPQDFAFTEVDPVVAKLIVTFKSAYDKLLCMAPSESDSGCGNESDEGCSSGDTADELGPPRATPLPPGCRVTASNCLAENTTAAAIAAFQAVNDAASIVSFPSNVKPFKVVPLVRRGGQAGFQKGCSPRTPQCRYRQLVVPHHRSLSDLPKADRISRLHMKNAKSLSSLNVLGNTKAMLHRNRFLPDGCSSLESDPGEAAQLRLQVERLSREILEARKQINYLKSCEMRRCQHRRFMPEPDYPDAIEYYSYASAEETAGVVQRFSDLFCEGREEIMAILDSLPEFAGSEELQLKTILSVIVLTYRSVHESVERRRERVFDMLGDSVPGTADNQQLDIALYRYMYRRAKSEHGMANAKEVTAQIWKTLYDFPSLKTCTRFNRFILECVSVVWDLVAGIDGKLPRMIIEYESCQFDESKHERFSSRTPRNAVIKQYLWPALIDASSGRCARKGIVIT